MHVHISRKSNKYSWTESGHIDPSTTTALQNHSNDYQAAKPHTQIHTPKQVKCKSAEQRSSLSYNNRKHRVHSFSSWMQELRQTKKTTTIRRKFISKTRSWVWLIRFTTHSWFIKYFRITPATTSKPHAFTLKTQWNVNQRSNEARKYNNRSLRYTYVQLHQYRNWKKMRMIHRSNNSKHKSTQNY